MAQSPEDEATRRQALELQRRMQERNDRAEEELAKRGLPPPGADRAAERAAALEAGGPRSKTRRPARTKATRKVEEADDESLRITEAVEAAVKKRMEALAARAARAAKAQTSRAEAAQTGSRPKAPKPKRAAKAQDKPRRAPEKAKRTKPAAKPATRRSKRT